MERWQDRQFQECGTDRANLAEDPDTTAAIAGALYGAGGILQQWLARLAWRERIEAKAEALFTEGTLSRRR